MVFEKLFKQQEDIKKALFSYLEQGYNRFIFYGTSGCGKTHLTEHIIQELEKQYQEYVVLIFAGDIHCSTKEYFPLISGLDSYCQSYKILQGIKRVLPKLVDDNKTGSFASLILDIILSRATENELHINNIFSEEELDLLYKIKSCIGRRKCIIYLDNLHWWDQKSLQFFYLLLKFSSKYLKELNSAILLCNVTTDQATFFETEIKSMLKDFSFKKFDFHALSEEEYKRCLTGMGLKNITDPIASLLYKITNQNFAITKSALAYPSSYAHMSLDFKIDEKDFLKLLIEKRLSELGASGEQITEVLKYASLIGYAFSLYELEYLVPFTRADLQSIIYKANTLSLVEPEKCLYRFTHEVIRELFNKKLEKNSFEAWNNLITCLKILHPYDYSSRIKYLLKTGDILELEKIYALEELVQLEKRGQQVQDSELEILISDYIKLYLNSMKNAYSAYQGGQYNRAIFFLKGIEEIYPIELLAIRDSLLSQCYTKSLSAKSRQQAVEKLTGYVEQISKFSEKQIWTKTMLTLIAAFIHIRDINNAKNIVDKLYEFYKDNASNCKDYQKELNILRRKATPFYELEIAEIYLKNSVDFFGSQKERGFITDPIQYFMSLINYSSNQICQGKFDMAFEHTQIAIKLYKEMPGIHFPRLEIAISNYILSAFLAKKMTADDAIKAICMLLSKLENIADRAIIKSNLAVFYFVVNKADKAINILTDLNTEIESSNCKEYSYIYHVKQNLLTIKVINSEWHIAEKLLNELDSIIPHLFQNYYFKQKHSVFKEIIMTRKGILYEDPLSVIINFEDAFNPAWKFYGLYFAFNTLEYWSES